MRETPKEVANKLSDFVNVYNPKLDEFCQEMGFQHRTLQQSFTQLCLRWLEFVAKDEYRTDLRNEDSKEVAKKLIENSPEFYGEPSKALRCI